MKKAKRSRMQTTVTKRPGEEIHTSIQYDDGEADDDEDEVDEMFDKARLEPVSFLSVAKSITKLEDNNPCWGCINGFGRPRARGKHKGLDFLNGLWMDKKDIMEDEVLAEILSVAYNKHVQIPEVKAGNMLALPWSPADVLKHLRYHMNDVKNDFMSMYHNYTILEHKLKDCVFVKNENGTLTTLDGTSFKQLLELGKTKLALGLAITKM